MKQIWYRNCNECGNTQVDNEVVNGEMTRAYRNRKCKKCKSEALDYGSFQWIAENEADEAKLISWMLE